MLRPGRITDGGGQGYGILMALFAVLGIGDAVVLLPAAWFGRGKRWGLVLLIPFTLVALFFLLLMFSHADGDPRTLFSTLPPTGQAAYLAPVAATALGWVWWIKARRAARSGA
jgi:hypothetical protein